MNGFHFAHIQILFFMRKKKVNTVRLNNNKGWVICCEAKEKERIAITVHS